MRCILPTDAVEKDSVLRQIQLFPACKWCDEERQALLGIRDLRAKHKLPKDRFLWNYQGYRPGGKPILRRVLRILCHDCYHKAKLPVRM